MTEDPVEFALMIEEMVLHSGLTHIEAVLKYCEDNYIDVEDIKCLVPAALKAKLRVDFQSLHYLPKTAQLEF